MTRARTDGLGQMPCSEGDQLLTWVRTFQNEGKIISIISAFEKVNCDQSSGNGEYQQQQVTTE